MAPIPGWAYLGVGIIVAGYSKFIQSRNDSAVMGFFFWVGIGLFVIGLFKLLIKYIFGKKKKEDIDAPPNESRQKLMRSGPFHCHKCKARLHEKSRYCNWCGAKQ